MNSWNTPRDEFDSPNAIHAERRKYEPDSREQAREEPATEEPILVEPACNNLGCNDPGCNAPATAPPVLVHPIEHETTPAAPEGTMAAAAIVLENTSLGDQNRVSRSPLSLRVTAALVVLGILTPLGIARTLSPSTQGLGTHQQLGLPPCSMRVLFDMRCPACGMTTSWSYWTRGQWWSSLRTNSGGACLAFLVVAVALIASRVVWTGRMPEYATTYRIGWAIVAIGVVTVVDWIVRLSL
ncbi:hypothetical protein FHS27_002285 [Rhodopirellula rubra]|uniref:DUF2752 domain-containing protein n=1 Tax=Aporhodopirellula rubra TaxID=980271 RepID=A0A7W5DXR2_9BACT|nr:DUF2752 domain-containing protein [Aporhodopirellula rubra]MBB3206476.1 hypothetical protein [Aporhodopirellula rubra]